MSVCQLWEYDELNSTGQEVFSPYELQDFDWEDVNKTVDYTHHTAELCGRHAHFSRNASLCLHVRTHTHSTHSHTSFKTCTIVKYNHVNNNIIIITYVIFSVLII